MGKYILCLQRYILNHGIYWLTVDYYRLLDRLTNKFLFFSTVFLISSQLNIGVLKIAYIGLVLMIVKNKKIDRTILLLIGVFFVGLINSLIYIIFNDIQSVELTNLLLRNRLYFIEIFFAVAVYIYLSNKSMQQILSILKYALLFNIIAGVFQLAILNKSRLNFLFVEPSAAGFFYCFMFFIIVYKMEHSKVAILFKYFGLMIMSKAQFLVLGAAWFYSRTFKVKIISLLFVGLIVVFFISYLRTFVVFDQIFLVITSLMENGLKGLSIDYGIYDSFVVRLSGIIVAFYTLIEHPLGIGWGSFNSQFLNYIYLNDLQYYLHGHEIEGIISGEYYASPKSHLMELFVSTGVFGVLFIMYLFRKIYRNRHIYLYYVLLATILASLFIELAPFYLYITIILILNKKERKQLLE